MELQMDSRRTTDGLQRDYRRTWRLDELRFSSATSLVHDPKRASVRWVHLLIRSHATSSVRVRQPSRSRVTIVLWNARSCSAERDFGDDGGGTMEEGSHGRRRA